MKQFKAESKKLLDMMINSIYTNKDVFLRELISNASDALDKRHFISLTRAEVAGDLKIVLIADRENKTLSVCDNGVGMNKEELESNLGTIAASGTLEFKLQQKEENSLIGQFGVGFYSAFMVAKKVEVTSRALDSEKAYRWTSSGVQGYDIKECEKEDVGTTVKLWLKDDDEDCKYSEYTAEYKLRALVKTYSDYIRYPIMTEVTKSKKEDEGEGYTAYTETETLNSMIPIWKKAKKDVKKEDYDAFYRSRFHDFRAPVRRISANIEGSLNYTALLFVPEKQPANYYGKDYEKGLALYSGGVLIKEKCAELLPDWLGFIKGVVDSPDLTLNVSREVVQQDRQLKFIADSLRKKILADFKKWISGDREGYEKFFAELGEGIKFGAYENFGEHKDELKDLLMFHSSTEKKPVLLSEYVSRMKEGQSEIYYACGESVEKTDALPQLEKLKDEGKEILYCVQRVDEFCLMTLESYDGKKFVSALKAADGADEEGGESKDFLKDCLDALSGKVAKVRFSSRLKTHAACLTADGEISLEMERVFAANGQPIKAVRALELNPEHGLCKRLQNLHERDKTAFGKLLLTLYDEACLMALGQVDDAAAFAVRVNELIECEK